MALGYSRVSEIALEFGQDLLFIRIRARGHPNLVLSTPSNITSLGILRLGERPLFIPGLGPSLRRRLDSVLSNDW
ncbi:hypothetical protein TorRG33x02_226690 [Trema orientale]|uniref:Uncharacterized protein n=1 Tax=Trema orientale TaxID=63057 RepID=A0A2P5E7P7_TREOI|nr:hypothetical protein TorRG33x02_226690 [Trema orientale]